MNPRPRAPLRLAIMAHFDPQALVDDHVVHLVKGVKTVARDVIVVSTAGLPDSEVDKLAPYARVIRRENVGYDFYSWKVGLEAVECIEIYDEVVLLNDSVYGPLTDLEALFARMQLSPADIWGLTANTQFAFHLQSYFLVFRRQAVMSQFFVDFWRALVVLADKNQIIGQYEIGLSVKAAASGLVLEAAFSPTRADQLRVGMRNLAGRLGELLACAGRRPSWVFGLGFSDRWVTREVNLTHILWDGLLAAGFPFVKVELLTKNPHQIALAPVLRAVGRTGYPPVLMRKHVGRVT